MSKAWIISGWRAHRCRSSLWRALGAAVLLSLMLAVCARAQEPRSPASSASVSETFSSLHEGLSATANDLLANAQRPLGEASSNLNWVSTKAPPLESSAAVLEKLGRSEPRNSAWVRLRVLQPILEQILREEGLPPELSGVVLVESGGLPAALSPRGARGIWQFMPDTARRYGLVVTPEVDERLDISKSTRAAARYLRDLYAEFGSWPLALAAYNGGENAVQRALDRTVVRDFISIVRAGMLPLETQNYVPAALNAMGMVRATGGRLGITRGRQSPIYSVVYAAAGREN